MSAFLELFKKQGGMSLIRQYWKNGVLIYAMAQFLLLGKSQRALEILRLGVELKTYNRIKKIFLSELRRFDVQYRQSIHNMHKSNKVWVYWSTGMEKTAPDIVKKCYASLKKNLSNRDIILLSKDNYKDYVDVPEYIVEKYDRGIIKHVHFADLLRIELLAKWGGTWIDSTVFCMSDKIPSYMLDSEFFVFQNLKPGLDGHAIRMSSWFITAYSNHKLILAQQALIRSYWQRYDQTIDYFFFHHFMSLVSEFYADDWKKIVQFPNSLPHVLLLMLFEKYDNIKWNALVEGCPFQKLSYKLNNSDVKKEGTYYRNIISV